MSSETNQKLDKIQSMIEEVQERQRISRFDTLMFLLFPLVLFLYTVLKDVISNFEILKSTMLWGSHLDFFLIMIIYFFGFALAISFVSFLWGYVTDGIAFRMLSCYVFVMLNVASVCLVAASFSNIPIDDVGRRFPQFRIALFFFFGLCIGRILANETVPRVHRKVQGWLDSILGSSLAKSTEKHERMAIFGKLVRGPIRSSGPSILHKFSWIIFLGLYTYIIYMVTLSDGISRTIYHVLYLIVLGTIAALDLKGVFS